MVLVAGCSGESVGHVTNDYSSALSSGEQFAALPQQLVSSATTTASANASASDTFYLAIKKTSLSKRWFLSAFLTQISPVNANNIPVTSLGTKVVSFKVQNGKVYVFNADDNHTWSDSLNPDIIVDAYPLVSSPAFDRLPGSSDYVLIDPSAGLNRFSAYSESLANDFEVTFTTDLMFSKRFNAYKDGVSFDQVFTGHSDLADSSGTFFENQFTASGTMTISLREYSESKNFVPSPMIGRSGGGAYYFGSDVAIVPNDGSLTQSAVKWSLGKGQAAKKWVISRNVLDLAKDPAFKDYDVLGAIKRGIEGWNTVLGYNAFDAAVASSSDTVGDEDKSFLFIDENPSAGFAFANWRSNPNTGEIRAASIYFSSVWFPAALQAADTIVGDGAPTATAPSVAQLKAMGRDDLKQLFLTKRAAAQPAKSVSLGWAGLDRQKSCTIRAQETIERLKLTAALKKAKGLNLNAAGLTKKDVVERFLTHVVMHEVGHTLGLRHNFKGSLAGAPAASVMDYLTDPDSVATFSPGTYDIAAVQYLYGLSTAKPTDAFCNDSYVSRDAECNVFDSGKDPYTESVKPTYLGIVDDIDIFGYLFGLDAEQHSFARGAPTAAVRSEAFDTLMKPARPIDPALLATDSFYGVWYDLLGEFALEASYLFTPAQLNNFGIRITTPVSSSKAPATIANCSGIIANSDKIRSFSSRSTCVTVLDTLHSDAALTALKTVRADLDKPENQPPSTATVAEKALFDSLKAKIDRVTLAWVK